MNANFKDPNQNLQSTVNLNHQDNPNMVDQDNPLEDRFELLSAYLDGEVTAAERRQVQQWLDNDPQMQRLYTRLLRLHHNIENIPIPKTEESTEQLSQGVFRRLDQRRRMRQILLWGGSAIAAVVVGGVSGLFPGTYSPTPQMAEVPLIENNPEPLMIALNRPAVNIPPEAIPGAIQP